MTVNVEFWAPLGFWMIEEAAQLCLNIEPVQHVNDDDNYEDYIPTGLPDGLPSEVGQIYKVILRAIRTRALKYREETDENGIVGYAVDPTTFMHWCGTINLQFPKELEEEIKRLSASQSQRGGFEASGADSEKVATGGRPQLYDWDLFHAEVVRVANEPDGIPDKQADLVRHMLSWYSDRGEKEPAESSVKAKISRIYKYLDKAKNL